MANANKLYVLVASGADAGDSATSGTLNIYIPSSADSTSVVKFDAQYWRSNAQYVATDKLILSAYNSTTKRSVEYELTYTGNLWEYTPDSTHFDAAGIRPGSSTTWTAQFFIRADTGTGAAPIVAVSESFALTVRRSMGPSPSRFGTVVNWYDAWDLTSGTSGTTTVTSWLDKSGLERNLTEATNPPTYYTDTIGRPHVRFDGTNDVLASTILAPATLAVLVACRYKAIDSTARPVLSWGSASIGGIYTDTTEVSAKWDVAGSVTSVAASSSTPLINQVFVAGAYKLGSGGAQNVIFNASAGTSGGTEANAAGVLTLGYDGTTRANVDIFEIWAFNAWSTGALSTITTFTGALEDATRALMAKWGI